MSSTDVNGIIRITALPRIHILGQKRGVHVMTEQEGTISPLASAIESTC
jgi:hypothetical protein